MRVVELSNHPGDMLTDAARQRERAGQRALAGYEAELGQYRARVQAVRARRDRARADRAWWTWLRLSWRSWQEKRQVPSRPVLTSTPTSTEEMLKAGIAGEELVAAGLGAALGEEWTLLRGYRNRRGEIDQLLLGPRGLFAIEVKNLNATVHAEGDRWRADKYDNYGNLVEQRVIADRKGRSPSEQLNEPAGLLERFLHHRSQPVAVQRVVVLTHRKSRLGTCRNLTVRLGISAGFVLDVVAESADRLSSGQCGEIDRLIRHDHEFNAQGRRPAPRPPR